MKKSLLTICTILLIFTFIFVISNINVNASHLDDKSLIYDIDEFKIDINRKEINISGWAFIHNVNNDSKKNTTIEVIAESNKGKKVNAEVEYSENMNLNKALYHANCQRVRQANSSKQVCAESYEVATCNPNIFTSSCRYDNVGFSATIDMDDLRKVGEGSTFTFKLRVTTSGITKEDEIVVSTGASNVNNGEPITIYKEEDINITVSNLTDKAKVRASYARVLTNTGGYAVASNFYWTQHSTYQIIEKSKCTHCENTELTDFGMYELGYVKSGSYAKPGAGSLGWAYASWVELIGTSVSVTMGEPKNPVECAEENYLDDPEPLICEEYDSYEEIIINDIDIETTISDDDSSHSIYEKYAETDLDNNESCSDDLKLNISGKTTIMQSGKVNLNLSPTEIYSGGGFYFDINYTGQTVYQICEPLTFTVTSKYDSWYSYCDSGRLSGGNCVETEEVPIEGGGTTTVTKIIGEAKRDYRCRSETSDPIKIDINNMTEIEKELVYGKMQDLLEKPKDKATISLLDSNEVDKNNKSEIGEWTIDYSEEDDDELWEPGEVIDYSIRFDLYQACIDRRTAKVSYKPSCNNDEVDSGQLYYVPLKQPSGAFPISIDISDVNVLKDGEIISNGKELSKKYTKWPIEYECGVECQQKLYDIDEDDSGNKKGDGSFKFIYRPINMTQPYIELANHTVFPGGRDPGSNWIPFMYDSNAVKSKLNRNTLEYNINLTQSDIISIKNSTNTNHYKNFNNITYKGSSNFINKEFKHIFETNTKNYNYLGECTDDCWNSEGSGY